MTDELRARESGVAYAAFLFGANYGFDLEDSLSLKGVSEAFKEKCADLLKMPINTPRTSDPKSGADELRARAEEDFHYWVATRYREAGPGGVWWTGLIVEWCDKDGRHYAEEMELSLREFRGVMLKGLLKPLEGEEMEAVGVLPPYGPECLENGQIVDVYPMYLAGPSDVLVYTSPQREAEPVGYIAWGALDQLDSDGSAKIWRDPNPSDSREQALYTSPPQLPDAQQERDTSTPASREQSRKARQLMAALDKDTDEDGRITLSAGYLRTVAFTLDPDADAILSPEGDKRK